MASKALALFLTVNLVVLGVASAACTLPTPKPALGLFEVICGKADLAGEWANQLGLIEANKVRVPVARPCCCKVREELDDDGNAICVCSNICFDISPKPGPNFNYKYDLPAGFRLEDYCGKTVPKGFEC